MALAESSSSVTVSFRGRAAFVGRDAGHAFVWLGGKQDFSTVAELSDTLARAIAVDDVDLVVDLSEVQFMGAAAVGVLIRARQFLELRSRSLLFRTPSSCARQVLDACGLADLIERSPVEATFMTRTAGVAGR